MKTTMTLTGILVAVVPLVLLLAWATAAHLLDGTVPVPPEGAWSLAWTALAGGIGLAGAGMERRDRAVRGSFAEIKARPEVATLYLPRLAEPLPPLELGQDIGDGRMAGIAPDGVDFMTAGEHAAFATGRDDGPPPYDFEAGVDHSKGDAK